MTVHGDADIDKPKKIKLPIRKSGIQSTKKKKKKSKLKVLKSSHRGKFPNKKK
tara:strand:+ start:673 stop:831 length:159 start_codon:yes stop_codon:yes gene_type:complete